ncbi:hypothetical protein [Streptomyces tritici]|uniref:hypothetical protein n=1 Tax=Streptomyces tritici TaxID=2054410 RepID=UPI003AF12756
MNDVELSEKVKGFAFSAPFDQAVAFMAACVERTAAVAFWAHAESGASAAPESLLRALELLWSPGPVDDERVSEVYDELQQLVEDLSESSGGDDPDPRDELAAEAVDVADTALGVVLGGSSFGLTQVALAAAEFAAALGERAGEDLAAQELAAQERDVRTLETGAAEPDLPALRATAAEDGRSYMAVAAAWHRTTTDQPPAPAPGLRVTATVDRSAVLARYANAVPHYGVVGRIVEGRDTGRYVRVDRVADLGWPEEGPDAKGVMIRIAGDPAVTVDVHAEWAEDWPAVEETFERDGRRVDWPRPAQ